MVKNKKMKTILCLFTFSLLVPTSAAAKQNPWHPSIFQPKRESSQFLMLKAVKCARKVEKALRGLAGRAPRDLKDMAKDMCYCLIDWERVTDFRRGKMPYSIAKDCAAWAARGNGPSPVYKMFKKLLHISTRVLVKGALGCWARSGPEDAHLAVCLCIADALRATKQTDIKKALKSMNPAHVHHCEKMRPKKKKGVSI